MRKSTYAPYPLVKSDCFIYTVGDLDRLSLTFSVPDCTGKSSCGVHEAAHFRGV